MLAISRKKNKSLFVCKLSKTETVVNTCDIFMGSFLSINLGRLEVHKELSVDKAY